MRTELKKFRVGLHLTQTEMAKATNVSRVTYALVENGKRGGSQDFWNNLQKAFDVPDEMMWMLQKMEERTDAE